MEPLIALSRRGFLSIGIKGAVGATALVTAGATRVSGQSQLSTDAALEQLLAGNIRFAEKRLTSFDEDLAILKQDTVEKHGGRD